MKQEVGFEQFGIDPDFRVTSFSDCIVVTTSSGCENQNLLILFLCHLFTEMANIGVFFRGALTLGLIHHSGNIIYGPALVRAYLLETEQAKHPRIILDPDISLPDLVPLGFRVGPHVDQAFGFMPVKRDANDNLEFINAVEFSLGKASWEAAREVYCKEFNEVNIQNNPRYWRDWPDNFRTHISSNLTAYRNDDSIRKKYVWLAQYFNSTYLSKKNRDSEKIVI
ncbi:hypothetical protein [Methylomonas methanica]|uniref:hypothetical protein n=1 Tax=Methylomonas methanica TaxID=421 RepID=UPI00059B7467|nr:hypothetical protein [Methylomonas methanica]